MARLMSLSVMPPTAACTICTLTSGVLSLSSDCASASCEPCTSALMISARVCASPSPMFSNMFSSLAACGGQLHVAVLALAEGGDFARTALVAQHHELVAGLRHLGQALDLDRDRRTGLKARLAVFVQHGAHPAEAAAGQHHVATLERAALHQHRGHRAAALVELGFDHQALGQRFDRAPSVPAPRPAAAPARAGRRCPAGLGRHRHERRRRRRSLRAPPDSATSSLLHAFEVGIGLVDLVHRHHDRHVGRLGVVRWLPWSAASRRRRPPPPGSPGRWPWRRGPAWP
jgi:hypothetical protein